jgi:hypothetical protein
MTKPKTLDLALSLDADWPPRQGAGKRGRVAQSAVRVCDVCHRGRKILLFDLFFRSSIARWLCYIPTSPTAVLKSGAGG